MKDSALREVAKARIRQMIRNGEHVEMVLKYDTPDEKLVPGWQLVRYRELLREENDQYKKELEEKKRTEEKQSQPQRKNVASKRKPEKKGLFRR